MDDRTDFSLDESDMEPAAESVTAPKPVVVIEYRNRGLASRLMPPALILIAALAIASYQRQTPLPLPPPHQPKPKIVAPIETVALVEPPAVVPEAKAAHIEPVTQPIETKPESAPEPVKEPEPKKDSSPVSPSVPSTVEPATSEPAAVVKAEEPSVRAPSPFDLDPSDGLQALGPPQRKPENLTAGVETTPTAPSVDPKEATNLPAALPVKPAEPSKDDILRDIAREAEQKDADRQDLEKIKANARALLRNEALTKVQSSRVPFHNELRQLLKQFPTTAGPEIKKLGERYGKEALPEVKAAYRRLTIAQPKRISRQDDVVRMRKIGVPEPLILDQICIELENKRVGRNGPRTEDEVRVLAAKALLAIPLTPTSRKPAPSDDDRQSRGPSLPINNTSIRQNVRGESQP